MSFKQKTWNDRISEHPTRRTLTDVSDNTTKTVTVAREEGTISQEGDAFSAANMNDLESRIADGFSTLSQDSVKIATKNTTPDSIAFGIDSNGNYGYIKEGADTVTPFKSQKDIDNAYNSGVAAADARVNTSSASYNAGYTNGQSHPHTYVFDNGQSVAGHVPNYQSLSAANFAIYSFYATAQASFKVCRVNNNSVRSDGLCSTPVSGGSGAISYNASTGVASISAPNGSAHADAGDSYGSSTVYLSSSCRLICFY